MTTPTPSRPWTHVAADVFHFNNCNWLVTVDLFSRYLEIQRLPSLTSSAVIERLKRLFSRLGIPDLVTTDGGTQFTSSMFADFKSSYGFTHRITDPHTPSSNGAAERAVRTAKWILRQKDYHLALLNYRTTPVEATGYSPARLLMGRELQSRLPIAQPAGEGAWQHAKLRDQKKKKKLEAHFNQRRGARDLRQLQPGDRVRIKTEKEATWSEPATVIEKLSRRSYLVELKGARYRRNRRHLMLISPFQILTQHGAIQHADRSANRAPAPPTVAPRPLPAALSSESRVAAPAPRPCAQPPVLSFEPVTTLPPPTAAVTPQHSSQVPKVQDPVTPPVFSPRRTRSGRVF